MAALVRFKDYIIELLRANFVEPSRSVYGPRHLNVRDEIHTGDGRNDTFTLDEPILLAVTTIYVDDVLQTKYLHYNIDLRNGKVVFFSDYIPADGAEIKITYIRNLFGESWIHGANPERPSVDDALDLSDYPRIVVVQLNESHKFVGIESDMQESEIILSFDIAMKEGVEMTNYRRMRSDGVDVTIFESTRNKDSVDVLAAGLINTIKRDFTNFPHLFHFDEDFVLGETEIIIDHDIGIFRKVIDIKFKGFDLNEAA